MERVWVAGVVSVGRILLYGWAQTDGPRLSETRILCGPDLVSTERLPALVGWICWILERWMDCKERPRENGVQPQPAQSAAVEPQRQYQAGTRGQGGGVPASGPPQAQGVIRGRRVRIAWMANAMEITAGSRVTRTESSSPSLKDTTARSFWAFPHN